MRSHQRRARRQQASWDAKCILEDDPLAVWAECRVLDISPFGVAIEVLEPLGADLIGRRIVLDLQDPPSGAFSVRVTGTVRDAGLGSGDGFRLGMELVDLTDGERAMLEVVEKMPVDGQADLTA